MGSGGRGKSGGGEAAVVTGSCAERRGGRGHQVSSGRLAPSRQARATEGSLGAVRAGYPWGPPWLRGGELDKEGFRAADSGSWVCVKGMARGAPLCAGGWQRWGLPRSSGGRPPAGQQQEDTALGPEGLRRPRALQGDTQPNTKKLHTHTHSHTHTLSLTHTYICSRMCMFSHLLSPMHTHTLTRTHTHTLSHTDPHVCTVSHTYTHTFNSVFKMPRRDRAGKKHPKTSPVSPVLDRRAPSSFWF